ncbi:hypothetical protein [Albidovulum sp.]
MRLLVALRDPLVAADIAETLAQGLPGAETSLARDCAQALALCAAGAAPAVAILAAAPETFAGSALARRLEELGTGIILIGDAAEERGEAAGYRVLHRPFSEAQLLQAVQAAGAVAKGRTHRPAPLLRPTAFRWRRRTSPG